MKKKVLLFLTSFLFFLSMSETVSACLASDPFAIFPHAEVDLIGFSRDNSAFALRYVYFDGDQKNPACRYPKINGRTPAQVVYLLNQAGKDDSQWIIYKDITADYNIDQSVLSKTNWDKKSCTSDAQASRKRKEAEKAFEEAGIDKDLIGTPVPIQKIKRNIPRFSKYFNSFIISNSILSLNDFDADIHFVDDVYLNTNDDLPPVYFGLVAKAEGYDPVVLQRWENNAGPELHEIQNVWLSPGQDYLIIIASHCGTTQKPFVVSLRNVAAQMLNSKGLAFHKKKLYDQSEKLFLQAWQTDGSYYRALFNLACAQALLNKKTDAVNSLKELINKEKSYTNLIRKDKDLDSLRKDAEFQALLQQ